MDRQKQPVWPRFLAIFAAAATLLPAADHPLIRPYQASPGGIQGRALDAAPALPTILVYAHPAPPKTFEQFTADFKKFAAMLRMQVVSAENVRMAGELSRYEYVYKMGPVPTRLAVLFANGKRYGMTYSEMEQKDFDRFGELFSSLAESFRVTK